ncbi:glycerophosphodiester phosphodiesterase family protein [Natronohydrobacter thiooxidans]|uniref:glycerophosphodiester phosphodiesterase family protein n=1 Tax=Natronohydrobacter thiooxidans TaxID=87172 RepID=UPI0008FF05A1|nr:glycerophosphodiester phosphodiesterase family protein [Natronohydrobacter thiooxidans]
MPEQPARLPASLLARPVAHRGLHGAGRPENSASAIRAALQAGYGIEIDLQLSADGVAMVFHDATLERLTEAQGPVCARRAQELSQIPLRGSTEPIPTLREVLTLVAGQAPLLIEIKDQTGTLSPGPEVLEQAVARDLAGYRGDVALMSFNPACVTALARLAPDRPRGLTTCAFAPEDWPDLTAERRSALAAIPDFDTAGCSFISHDWTDLGAAPVAALARRDIPILCWTIRSPAQEQTARTVAQNITFENYLP